MAKKVPLRDRAKDKLSSAGLWTLELERVEVGKINCYQRISWEISLATSGGNTRCRLVIKGHGYDVPLAEQDAPAADTLYWYKDPTWLYAGERLALIVDQAQAATVAEINAIGYWTEDKEGIV
jgi:hypothetical protein